MNRDTLLQQIKQAVQAIEPDAEIILFGSRARGDAQPDSDWDVLVLVDGVVDVKRTDTIRHKLHRIEWEYDEVICSIVKNRQQWRTPLYQAMPLHQNIVKEGIRL